MKIRVLEIVMAITFTCYAQGAFAQPISQMSTLVETVDLMDDGATPGTISQGPAGQGLALGDDFYYTSNIDSISRFDKDWNFIETVAITLPGVDHLGAIDYSDGYIWGGFLSSTAPFIATVAKIQASDLSIVQTWDLTPLGLTIIDPVTFDGEYLWIGQRSSSLQRFLLEENGNITPKGVLNYDEDLYKISQGLRVAGDRLYSIHTFGTAGDGLFEFIIPENLENLVEVDVAPVRRWNMQRTPPMQGNPGQHLQGFGFVPGSPDEIWEAQGFTVDRYVMEGLGIAVPEPSTLAIVFCGSTLFLALRRSSMQLFLST